MRRPAESTIVVLNLGRTNSVQGLRARARSTGDVKKFRRCPVKLETSPSLLCGNRRKNKFPLIPSQEPYT
jgi:hypothetical protein